MEKPAHTLILLDIKLAQEEARRILGEWKVSPASYFAPRLTSRYCRALTRVVTNPSVASPALDTVLGHAGGCGLHPFATTSEARGTDFASSTSDSPVNLGPRRFGSGSDKIASPTHDLHSIVCGSYWRRPVPSCAPPRRRCEFHGCMALNAGPRIRVNVVARKHASRSLKVFRRRSGPGRWCYGFSGKTNNESESIADAFCCSSTLSRQQGINGQEFGSDYGTGIGNRL